MEQIRRPSMADRTMSSPLSISTSSTTSRTGHSIPPSILGMNLLTPPSSPRHSRSSSNLSNKTDDHGIDDPFNCTRSNRPRYSISDADKSSDIRTSDGILICSFDVEILKDQRDRNQVLGYGAWSTVFRGTCRSKPTSGLVTPPLSPTTRSRPPVLVAVKQPARKDAKAILESEAKVLSYLRFEPENEKYIVPFHGLLTSTSSLILTVMPLSLEEHIRRSAKTANANFSTSTMFRPVIGSSKTWLDLAYRLVSALNWLHTQAMVVHGDIKPGNVLLDKHINNDEMEMVTDKEHFAYRPLFADFSSSQRLGSPTKNTLSAITREYTAPELLSSKVLSNPDSTATTASDVFSLAVTLLVAATGNTMVYSGSVFQRQAMATQGWMIINTIRSGPMEEAARVPRQGIVERTLDQAVLRDGLGRIDAGTWMSKLEDSMKGDPNK